MYFKGVSWLSYVRYKRCRRKDVFSIETDRLLLRILRPSYAPYVADYLIRNRAFHKPFHQKQDDSYFSAAEQREYLRSDLNRYYDDRQYAFWISYKDESDRIIGRLSFSSVIRGALSSCLVGYHLDKDEVGKGLMSEAIKAGCKYMFEVQKLHRIQADIMPSNLRSQTTAVTCGFRRQGLNERYMNIDGEWRDHYVYARINEPDWSRAGAEDDGTNING